MNRLLKALLLPVFIISLSGCSTSSIYPNQEKYVSGSQVYEGSLTTLNVNYQSGELTLVEDPTASNISVIEEGDFDDKYQVHSYFEDNTLNVQFMASGVTYRAGQLTKKLTITYPSVTNLVVDMTSGQFNAENINAFNASIRLTSGKIALTSISATNLAMSITSGTIDINKIEASNVNVSMTSGQLMVGSLSALKANFSGTSGSVLMNLVYLDEMNISLTSGNIDLTVPSCGASFKVEKTSGSFDSIQPYMVVNDRYNYGEAHAIINLTITSGSILIR